jgi:predicted RND superfamily exporter protein
VLLTLLLESICGKKIGVLTVNLGTIVFVIALSHLVYMTFNWQTLADRRHRLGKESPNLAPDARRMTFPASFWSMVCASLGFGSLLIVHAKPLRELGLAVCSEVWWRLSVRISCIRPFCAGLFRAKAS